MCQYCFNYFSAYNYVVPAKGKVLAKTDIQIACPDGSYGRVGKHLYIGFE